MTRTSAMAVLILAAAVGLGGLSACDERHEMAANPKVCADFKATKPPSTTAGATPAVATAPPLAVGAEGAQPVDDCVRKWAYSLASSRDDADTVAGAAVAACNVQLARWNQQALSQPGGEIEASSIITGQPTTPLGEHAAFAGARALLYVVQARAGHCAAPPITNGVPDGVA
jgi:hypothetical protein